MSSYTALPMLPTEKKLFDEMMARREAEAAPRPFFENHTDGDLREIFLYPLRNKYTKLQQTLAWSELNRREFSRIPEPEPEPAVEKLPRDVRYPENGQVWKTRSEGVKALADGFTYKEIEMVSGLDWMNTKNFDPQGRFNTGQESPYDLIEFIRWVPGWDPEWLNTNCVESIHGGKIEPDHRSETERTQAAVDAVQKFLDSKNA